MNVARLQNSPLTLEALRGAAAKAVALAILASLGGVFVRPAKSLPLRAAPVQSGEVSEPPAPAPAKPKIMRASLHKLTHVVPLKNMMSGLASWYGKALQGRRSADGGRFDLNQLTAAHRTLPFGTMVRVTDLSNHRTVVVKITDRGMLNPNRVIDLSYAAASELGMVRAGVHPVSLEVLAQATPVSPSNDDAVVD